MYAGHCSSQVDKLKRTKKKKIDKISISKIDNKKMKQVKIFLTSVSVSDLRLQGAKTMVGILNKGLNQSPVTILSSLA